MKTLYCIIASLLLSVALFGQAPPVIRQSLDTNNADIAVTGRSPVWNGTKWVMVDTNTFGSGVTFGDLLWTNTANEYLPTQTNTFGFAKEGGGLWVGKNTTNFWGHLSSSDVLISFADTSAGDAGNRNLIVGVADSGNQNSIDLTPNALNALLTIRSDPPGFVNPAFIEHFADVTGSAFIHITPTNGGNPTVAIDVNNDSYLNGAASQLGILTNAPKSPLHVRGTATIETGITNNGTYQHAVGAFTGALFVSSNANGVAYWTTNVNNIGVTNLSVYNNVIFNGGAVSNFNRDLNWTNTGVILRNVATNTLPPLRWGVAHGGAGPLTQFGGVQSDYWNATNVGPASVALGSNVLAIAYGSAVLGGWVNLIGTNATAAVIAGGSTNLISSNSPNSAILGGALNTINAGSQWSSIGGGVSGTLEADWAVIGGGSGATINAGADYAVIAGGLGQRTDNTFTFIGGGANNFTYGNTGTRPAYGVILGGEGNGIQSGEKNFIGSGTGNRIGRDTGTTTAHHNFIGGGVSNLVCNAANGTTSNSFLGGGFLNQIGQTASHSSVLVGGAFNLNQSAPFSFIGAGIGNSVGGRASALAGGSGNGIFDGGSTATNSFIGGGMTNSMQGADNASILGGRFHIINSSGDGGFIVGGHSNNVNAADAGVIGNRGTNTLTLSVDIAPNGDITKTTFHSASNYFRAPVVIGAGGALITNVLTASAALTFTGVAAQTSQDQPITVTGTTTNDVVTLGIPFQVQGAGAINTCFSAFTSNDTVWVRFNNYSSATRSTNGVFKVMVTRF